MLHLGVSVACKGHGGLGCWEWLYTDQCVCCTFRLLGCCVYTLTQKEKVGFLFPESKKMVRSLTMADSYMFTPNNCLTVLKAVKQPQNQALT